MHWGAGIDWTDPRVWQAALAPIGPDVIRFAASRLRGTGNDDGVAFLHFHRGAHEVAVFHNGLGGFQIEIGHQRRSFEEAFNGRPLGYVGAQPSDPRGVIVGVVLDIVAFVDKHADAS